MATTTTASAVIPISVETVWDELREFTFPRHCSPDVESCSMESDAAPQSLGSVRITRVRSSMWGVEKKEERKKNAVCMFGGSHLPPCAAQYENGTVARDQLVMLSDLTFRLGWRTLSHSDASFADLIGSVQRIELKRITENASTLCIWHLEVAQRIDAARLAALGDGIMVQLADLRDHLQQANGVFGALVHTASDDDLTELLRRNAGAGAGAAPSAK